MPTIKDVKHIHDSFLFWVNIAGAEEEVLKQFHDLCRVLGDAIRDDLGLKGDEKPSLVKDFKLGSKASLAFTDLKAFVIGTAEVC